MVVFFFLESWYSPGPMGKLGGECGEVSFDDIFSAVCEREMFFFVFLCGEARGI